MYQIFPFLTLIWCCKIHSQSTSEYQDLSGLEPAPAKKGDIGRPWKLKNCRMLCPFHPLDSWTWRPTCHELGHFIGNSWNSGRNHCSCSCLRSARWFWSGSPLHKQDMVLPCFAQWIRNVTRFKTSTRGYQQSCPAHLVLSYIFWEWTTCFVCDSRWYRSWTVVMLGSQHRHMSALRFGELVANGANQDCHGPSTPYTPGNLYHEAEPVMARQLALPQSDFRWWSREIEQNRVGGTEEPTPQMSTFPLLKFIWSRIWGLFKNGGCPKMAILLGLLYNYSEPVDFCVPCVRTNAYLLLAQKWCGYFMILILPFLSILGIRN